MARPIRRGARRGCTRSRPITICLVHDEARLAPAVCLYAAQVVPQPDIEQLSVAGVDSVPPFGMARLYRTPRPDLAAGLYAARHRPQPQPIPDDTPYTCRDKQLISIYPAPARARPRAFASPAYVAHPDQLSGLSAAYFSR